MATEVGKGVELGLRAMGHLQRETFQRGEGYDTETKGYTKDDIAALMCFARDVPRKQPTGYLGTVQCHKKQEH